MASQVKDIIGNDRTNPEGGSLIGAKCLFQRRQADQKRGPSQTLLQGRSRPGFCCIDVKRRWKVARKTCGNKSMPRHSGNNLSGQRGMAASDPAFGVNLHKLGV
jgi:hypothetical protein